MATQRYISTSFWDDEWIQTLDPSEKLLYLYFMTNPLTNIAGVYKLTDKRISFDTGFNLDTIRHLFDKFETAKKVYRHGEYLILPSWPKHQRWQKRKKIRKGIDNCLSELPKDVYEKLQNIKYSYPLISYDKLSEHTNYIDTDTDTNSDTDIDDETKRFKKPTIEEIAEYCRERKNGIDPEYFYHYYEARGWKLNTGKKVVSWKSCVITFEKNACKYDKTNSKVDAEDELLQDFLGG